MKSRRFLAPDMRRAIQLVRTEHGADAVILSSRAVEGGVEIVSALDYDQDLIAQMLPQARSAGDAIRGGEDKGVRQADRSHGDGDGDGDARTAEVSEETGVTFGKRREVSPAAAPATDVENAREGGADDRVEAAKSAVREKRAHAAAPSAVPTAAAIAAAVRAAEA